MHTRHVRGSAAVDVVIGAAVVIFVILPLFSAVIERFIMANRAQTVRDSMDMANMAVYNSMNAAGLGKASVSFLPDEAMDTYTMILSENMKLDRDLNPLSQSIANGRVAIESIAVYTDALPLTCPDGVRLSRPSVHSRISVPVKPALYRQVILELLGKDHVDMVVHMDSEIPIDR